jgi:16S rRNA (adenine1518-N6/adenine1519-N6)-dimethyltransferase
MDPRADGSSGQEREDASAARPPWSAFRSELARMGFHPSRRLGQNFLVDENMVRAIVRDAGVSAGDRVLEIGAGCGFLTLHLAAAGARVVSFEIDERLAAVAERLCGSGARVERADVLSGKNALAPSVLAAVRELSDEGPWSLVSNLPYSVAGPVLVLLARTATPPRAMTVLVQLEVAERIAASPGTPAWGPLSVELQLEHEARLLRRLAPELFWPRPRVESALVRLERRPALASARLREAITGLVRALFQRRRQTVGRVLGERLGSRDAARALCLRLQIDPARRGETLDLRELAALAAEL